MRRLESIQRGFLAATLYGGDPSLAGAVRDDRLGAARRLAIYRNNAMTSLRSALGAVYPVIEKLVGEDYFRQVSAAYVRSRPSRSGNLHDFGEHFPAFLATLPEMAGLGYASDVARVEWARHRAFHARDETAFPLDRLAPVPPERHGSLRFVLSRATTVIASRYPVITIWEANQPDSSPDGIVDLAVGGESAAILRIGGQIVVRRLDPGEHAMLAAFAAGLTLDEAIGAARGAEPGVDVAACLRAHVASGVVSDFTD